MKKSFREEVNGRPLTACTLARIMAPVSKHENHQISEDSHNSETQHIAGPLPALDDQGGGARRPVRAFDHLGPGDELPVRILSSRRTFLRLITKTYY